MVNRAASAGAVQRTRSVAVSFTVTFPPPTTRYDFPSGANARLVTWAAGAADGGAARSKRLISPPSVPARSVLPSGLKARAVTGAAAANPPRRRSSFPVAASSSCTVVGSLSAPPRTPAATTFPSGL